jgi:hypothetical protein
MDKEQIAQEQEVRRGKMQALIDTRFKGNKAAFAKKVGKAASYISACLLLANHKPRAARRGIGPDFARHIEIQLDLPRGWMDGVAAPEAPTLTPQTRKLLDDFNALPEGLRKYIADKASGFRQYWESLSADVRSGDLGAPEDPQRRHEWELSVEAAYSRLRLANPVTRMLSTAVHEATAHHEYIAAAKKRASR